MNEVGQIDDANGAATLRQCAVFVEEKHVMISRRKPAELQDALGFIQWNKFCDRLDEALGPLRSLAETSAGDVFSGRVKGGHQEQTAKTTALQRLQEVCDKLEKNHPGLQCTLYCPFHSSLVSNWHIVVNVDCQQLKHPGSQETSVQAIQSSEMTESVVQNQVSESAREEEEEESSSDIPPRDSDAESQDAPPPQTSGLPQEAEIVGDASANQSCSSTGRGILGKDFIEHTVLPTDTFGGVCLAYNISAARLRQANLLSRDIDSLSLAPKILAIPISDGYFGPAQDQDSQEFKLNSLKRKFSKLGIKEAKA